jgi:hypothetical protein
MDAKLDCEVDVEEAVGAVDMMVRGEEGALISRRPCLRPITAHSPCLEATPNECLGLWAFHVARMTRSFPINFLFIFSQQFNDLKALTQPEQPERS